MVVSRAVLLELLEMQTVEKKVGKLEPKKPALKQGD